MFKTKKTVATIFSLPLLGLVLGIYAQACWSLSWLVLGVIFILVVVMITVGLIFRGLADSVFFDFVQDNWKMSNRLIAVRPDGDVFHVD